MNAITRAAALLICGAALLLSPTDLSSCGPFFLVPVFTPNKAPLQPEAGFAKGQLGILQPSFTRFYLYIAYRYLSGAALTAAEQAALFPPAAAVPGDLVYDKDWNVNLTPAMVEWLAARKSVPNAPPPPKIDSTYSKSTRDNYVEYTNCLEDAFRSATATLKSRSAKFGVASPYVRDWLAGQDAVFGNCGANEKPLLPSDNVTPELSADRAYQTAAALFYANQLDDAEARFRQIAGDRRSPWSQLAAYLVARCEIRKATLNDNKDAFSKAKAQLESLPKDSATEDLLRFVNSRIDPEGRLIALGRTLVKPDAALARDLTDYRALYDKFEENDLSGKDELTSWLYTFHKEDGTKATAAWQANRTSMPWLLAALDTAHAGDTELPKLFEDAGRVGASSPAYLTVTFHTARLRIERNENELARQQLDRVLQNKQVLPSDRNLFLAERAKVAANWDEFLKFVQRQAVAASFETDKPKPQTVLDADGSVIFTEQTPLSLLAAAAVNPALAPNVRENIAQAAWVRAVLLDDQDLAQQLAPVVQKLTPSLERAFAEYLAEPKRDAKRFAGLLLILRTPGLRPFVIAGFPRDTDLTKIDDLRDNWWCANRPQTDPMEANTDYYRMHTELDVLKPLYPNGRPQASFFTAAQKAEAEAQRRKLNELAPAPDYLSAQVVAYALTHAQDPRVPEALHLAVRSTRYGCTDAQTGTYSKQAYDLLHQRYPNSPWAAQTKYWFK